MDNSNQCQLRYGIDVDSSQCRHGVLTYDHCDRCEELFTWASNDEYERAEMPEPPPGYKYWAGTGGVYLVRDKPRALAGRGDLRAKILPTTDRLIEDVTKALGQWLSGSLPRVVEDHLGGPPTPPTRPQLYDEPLAEHAARADEKVRCMGMEFIAGEPLNAGDVLYLKMADGKVYRAPSVDAFIIPPRARPPLAPPKLIEVFKFAHADGRVERLTEAEARRRLAALEQQGAQLQLMPTAHGPTIHVLRHGALALVYSRRLGEF